jgi:hypothetical protein
MGWSGPARLVSARILLRKPAAQRGNWMARSESGGSAGLKLTHAMWSLLCLPLSSFCAVKPPPEVRVKGVHLVLPYLLMGSADVATNKDELKYLGVKHIMNCASEDVDNFFPGTAHV